MRKLVSLLLTIILLLAAGFGGYIAYDSIFMGGEFTKSLFATNPNEPTEHEHDFSNGLQYNDTHHYNQCVECNKILNGAKHEFSWVIDSQETDYSNGVKHKACNCGLNRNENTIINEYIGTNDNIIAKNSFSLDLGDNSSTFIYNNTQSIYHDGLQPTITKMKISDGITTEANFRLRYTSVLKEVDGTFSVNKDGMQLIDAAGNGAFLGSDKWVSLSYCTPGFIISDISGNDYKIMFNCRPNKFDELFAIDILVGFDRYRLSSTDVVALCQDFIKCGYVDIEFGITSTENTQLDENCLFGFSFSTENCEVTYISDNSGTITADTLWNVVDINTNNITSATSTISNILGWASEGLYNSDVNVTVGHGYYNGKYSKADTGAIMSFYDSSAWFVENSAKIISSNKIEA